MKFAFSVLVACNIMLVVTTGKPYQLRILSLFNPPYDGQYKEISRFVADVVNNRSDLLKDYEIEFQFEQESLGIQSASKVINFYRDGVEHQSGGYFQSPIIIGPHFSSGCKGAGMFLQHVNYIGISASCGMAIFADRARFPNLYLMYQPTQFTALMQLAFMREVGKWNQFAMLTNAASLNDYGTALQMYKIAIDSGMKISWLNFVIDITEELVASLKATDARVVSVFMTDFPTVARFLCLAYKAGMTGSRYVFVANKGTMDINTLPESAINGYCNRSSLFEQMKQSFWAGVLTDIGSDTIKSELGFSRNDLNALMQKRMNSTLSYTDPLSLGEYDVFIRTVYALHNTEEELKRQNLSLRDYNRLPRQVMQAADRSLLETKIAGLHVNRMGYNKAGLPEGEWQSITMWSRANGYEIVATGYQEKNFSDISLAGYVVKTVLPIKWATTNEQPPRDHRETMRKFHTIPFELFVAITVMAGIIFCCQSIASGVSLFKRSPICHLIGWCGCVLLDGASVCFALNDSPENGYEDNCSRMTVAVALLAIGLSATNSLLTMRAVVVQWACRPLPPRESINLRPSRLKNASVASGRRKRSSENPQHPLMSWKRCERIIGLVVGTFVSVIAIVVLCWFLTDPPVCAVQTFGQPLYLSDKDIVIESLIRAWATMHMAGWALALTFFNAVALISGSWFAYVAKRQFDCPGIIYIRFGLTNSLMLLLASILVVVVVGDPVGQQIALAFASLLFSAVASVVLFQVEASWK